jgi:DNA-binding winged helix-turn-helix (wHTH) protein
MILAFDDVVVSVHTRELFRSQRPVHLAPKAFDLLLLLIARRPNAVSKSEILSQVWPETHVSDATLTSVISDVREAIGDDARAPRRIRTLHRFGYAFAADMVQQRSDPEDASAGRSTMGWLVAESWRVPIYEGEMVFGREGEDVVPLPAASVSRRHAALVVERGRALLRDLGSKNGTFVDGVRLAEPIALHDGSRLRFGTFEAIFRAANGAVSTETV